MNVCFNVGDDGSDESTSPPGDGDSDHGIYYLL